MRRVNFKMFVAVSLLAIPMLQAAEHPNVVVILVDDLGYGDLSAYGATDLRSPHVDALISAGMRFDNFYANCPVCSPTRASLLTGRYPELVGVPGVIRTHPENSWGFLDPRAVMLPEVLRQTGYDTAIVGKWHLGLASPSTPNERGFDHFHGYLGDMMDDYYKHRRHGINYMRLNEREIDPAGHATDLFTDWACDYLQQRQANDKPFFLYLAYNAPHTPIQPPADWLERVKQREGDIADRRAKLVALIEHMDAGIGKVMETLEETQLADKTLVIFSSDNGGQVNVGANNGATRDGKQSMYEGGLRVPTCVVWPGKVKAGSRTTNIGMTMDLYATICDAAGIKLDHRIDGISILPTLLGKAQDTADRNLFFHRREGGTRYAGLTIQAVRQGDWKLLQNSPFAPLELYHLKVDPLETKNLAEQNRRMFNTLSAVLRRQVQRGGAVPWQRPQRRDDE
ncbi:MAG TPA: N-acetylgalactosamine 6-sulfate sulfatase [Planctomycetaceae bacterium]|nr:N-acetylgalactosamine 6-sulfate sulfatase [Blastopirellula sp.]HAY79858.1 N-acetylgalactosamine 6-sulfate sulfatase [Planctomycetaceae bacterium]